MDPPGGQVTTPIDEFGDYAVHGQAVQTGRVYDNRFVSVITIKERKVTHWRDYLDPVAVFNAIGWHAHPAITKGQLPCARGTPGTRPTVIPPTLKSRPATPHSGIR
jgi:hypothetical protein